MSEELYKDRVRERDLDNFLVEELQASTSFRNWFVDRIRPALDAPIGEERVRKSPPRSDGRQTDVELGWFGANGELVACVLIESKITADFQPAQAEAYRAETAEYRWKLGERRACSALIAPAQKLAALAGREHFDVAISLEEVADTLRERLAGEEVADELAARLRVRISLLEALCGKRSGTSWSPVTIAGKRDFATQYADLASLIVPNLTVRPSTDGPKALTRIFDGLRVQADFPCAVSLRHEFGTGSGFKYANILFAGAAEAVSSFKSRPELFASVAAETAAAGKSLAVRIATPSLIPDGGQFEVQKDKVKAGLEAVSRLARWFEEHQPALASILRRDPQASAPPDANLQNAVVADRSQLVRELEIQMRSLADIAIRDYDYTPRYFLNMINENGALATAHALLAGQPSEGFTKLWSLGALHLSVEALVGREPWASSELFSEDELRRARRRLRDAGYVAAAID